MMHVRTMRVWLALLSFSLPAAPLPAQFLNVTAGSGISVPPAPVPGEYGRGSAWADFDGDGDVDLVAPLGPGLPVKVFWNGGASGFTSQIILPGSAVTDAPHGCVAADFDNDGDQDVYVCLGSSGSGPPNLLLVNQGGGVFTDEAVTRGVGTLGHSYAASWGDFNRDGWLDLYVGNLYLLDDTPPDHTLYINDGTGSFIDVTVASGAASPGKAFVVIWHDYNDDMWPDIVIANDKGSASSPPSALLRNNRNGTFTDVAPAVNANAPIDGMGATLADIDLDGDWDMFQTNEVAGHVLFVWDQVAGAFNLPMGNWYLEAASRGLQTGGVGWATQFGDYDCDGDPDLLMMLESATNRLFRNDPGATFTDVTLAQGIPGCVPGHYSSTWVDYDDDGDLDIWDSGHHYPGQLAQNQVTGVSWLKVHLTGTISNRDGLGALLIARTGSREQRRMITSGEGYLTDGDKRAHFGLGAATVVDQLEIRWPSGTVQILENVAANQILSVVEPRFTSSSPTIPLGSNTQIGLDVPDDVGHVYLCGFTFDGISETRLPDGRIARFDPTEAGFVYSTTTGNPVLYPFLGVLPPGGAGINVTLPAGALPPGFTIPVYFIAFTVGVNLPSAVKSIIGPQRFEII